MSATKFHGAIVVEDSITNIVLSEIQQIGGNVLDSHMSTMEEVEKTVPNGYALAKYHGSIEPLFRTIIFEYPVEDPNRFVEDLLAPLSYL